MTEALSIVASLWTIWAQSSILAENKEFDRFKEEESIHNEHHLYEYEKRRLDIIEASLQRRKEIYYNNNIVISQTKLGEK